MANTRTPASTKQHFIGGITAGTITAASLYPIDLVKVRYQVYDKSGSAYRSLYGAFQTIVKEEGVRGLFQGVGPAVVASAVSWGGYIYLYEQAKKRKLAEIGANSSATSGSVNSGSGDIAQLGTMDHLLSGVEAGAYMVLITNPLWLLKTRMQTQTGTETVMSHKGGSGVESGDVPRRYQGPLDAVKVILREEGPQGFYRGVVPALFLTSHGAVQFAVYEQLKVTFRTFQDQSEHHNQPAVVSMATGFMSKIVASTLTYPYQVIKSRLQQRGVMHTVVEEGRGTREVPVQKYSGVWDCASQIMRREGLKGFFRGLVANCIKVAPSAAVTFLVYEETLKLLMKFDIASF